MWFRVDDSFVGHPKTTGLSNDSAATWLRAGDWSAWQLTDGAVPAELLAQFAGDAADPGAVARDLVDRRLWEPAEDGWQFHDWGDWNPTRAQVLKKRKADADRRARWLASRRDPETSHAVSHGVTQTRSDHAVSHGVSHGVTELTSDDANDHGVSHAPADGVAHSRPTRPDPTVREGRTNTGEQSSSDRNARESRRDDDDELTQVQALMAAAGRPVSREDAASIRAAVLAKSGGEVRNPRAFIGRVLGDPGQARSYAPGAGHTPTAREIIEASRRPGGPSDDAAARAAEARQQLAGRPRPLPAAGEPAPAAGLHEEALARDQLAEERAARLLAAVAGLGLAGLGEPDDPDPEEVPPPDDADDFPF